MGVEKLANQQKIRNLLCPFLFFYIYGLTGRQKDVYGIDAHWKDESSKKENWCLS